MLFLAVKTLRDPSYAEVYDVVERPLQLAQTAAVLEVFFFMFKISFCYFTLMSSSC